jgi:hypothetical protein
MQCCCHEYSKHRSLSVQAKPATNARVSVQMMIRHESSASSWKHLTTSNRSFYANHVHAFRLGAALKPP